MEVLVENSIFLRSDCGGRGICGKCSVDVITPGGVREAITACDTRVEADLTIEIPGRSLLSSHIISKAPVTLPPSFTASTKALGSDKYGFAVDLGTTTIAIYLVDRSTAKILASIAVKNPQSLYGDDVMSRIGAIGEKKGNLRNLQHIVVGAIQWGATELLNHAAIENKTISSIVVVGNPTMIHILLGIDPHPIGLSPYQPAFFESRTVPSDSLGLQLGHAPLTTLPQISGFIGGDILAAALATELMDQEDGTLLIDLGTNGELLFKGKDGIYATSCATGPAFEGASVSCGMQAIPGAINKIEITDSSVPPRFTLIHSEKTKKPVGICGTGIISGVAELWRNRLIGAGGGFIDTTTTSLRKDAEGKLRYNLVTAEGDTGADVFISQKDIRSVQLGKAALITGIEFLTRAAGYEIPKKIIIAGAFGSHIDKQDLITIGMIPQIDPRYIEISGNSAGAGAVMIVVDKDNLKKSIDLAERITTIELATDMRFQEAFVERLGFPE